MAIASTLQLRKTRLEWLARRLALSGGLSRREAVAAIERGAVEVCDEAVISCFGRQIPQCAAVPALFGMIKPPRVANTYTLDASGPTLKTLLAQVASANSEQFQRVQSDSACTRQRNAEGDRDASVGRDVAEWNSDSDTGNVIRDRRTGLETNTRGKGYYRDSSISTAVHAPGHLIPVNPLPLNAEGLVLLTNDGAFAHALRDISNNIVTAYDFRVSGPLPSAELWQRWALGVRGGGVDYGRVWVQLLRPCPSGAWLRLKLVEPPGADFRSLLGTCGLKIRRMRLHAFGPYLSSSVPPGCLLPLPIDHALLPLAPRKRRKLMLVPADGEMQQTVQALKHLKSLKGGGFAAARLLKENSVVVNARSGK